MNKELCGRYGIDWEAGVARFRGNEQIYEMLLGMFVRDDTFRRMALAYDRGELREMFACAQELKGVSGNASLMKLFGESRELVEYLRSGGEEPQRLRELFTAVEKAYRNAVEGIRLLTDK